MGFTCPRCHSGKVTSYVEAHGGLQQAERRTRDRQRESKEKWTSQASSEKEITKHPLKIREE